MFVVLCDSGPASQWPCLLKIPFEIVCGRITSRDQRKQGNEGDEGKETILKHTLFQNAIMISATLHANLKNKK